MSSKPLPPSLTEALNAGLMNDDVIEYHRLKQVERTAATMSDAMLLYDVKVHEIERDMMRVTPNRAKRRLR